MVEEIEFETNSLYPVSIKEAIEKLAKLNDDFTDIINESKGWGTENFKKLLEARYIIKQVIEEKKERG